MVALHVLVYIVTNETLMWAFTINRHARWMQYNEDEVERRVNCTGVSCTMVKNAAILTSLLSIMLGMSWILANALNLEYHTFNIINDIQIYGIIIVLVQLSFIHFFAIVARCIGMPRLYWPLLSKWVSKVLIKLFNIQELPL